MMNDDVKQLGVTLALGLAGAGLATAAGLPAAALIGATVATSVAAAAGLRLRMDPHLRNFGFATIGLSLGSGVGPGILADLGHWGFSLAVLCVSLAVTLWMGALILRRGFGIGQGTAVLATSPGAMSYALAIAEEGRGDATAIMVIQSLRLFLLASVLPVLIWALVEAPVLPVHVVMGVVPFAALLVVASGSGWALARLGLPAAWLIAGFATSGVAHGTDLVQGLLPGWALFAGFALTGATIGARFSGLNGALLRRYMAAALVAGGVSALVSFAFAALVAAVTALPLGQLWVAFAPGGVEAMAAMGLALGYDPAFVAVHHLVRLAVLFVLVPLFLRR